jgi:predicted hydrolase (HD superfamily)
MSLTYDEALKQLHAWTETPSLRTHARSVELVMRQAAYRYGAGAEDELQWGITGLLHDADYEKWPDEHPHRIIDWLKARGEETIAHAVAAHYTKWGVTCENALDKALLACDELAGFVVACCLVRPDGIHSLAPSSVKKKLKDRTFAAKVDRDEVKAGMERLGAEPDAHIQLVIDALKPHADELGLNGKRGAPPPV